jgi:hypothetical protein
MVRDSNEMPKEMPQQPYEHAGLEEVIINKEALN